MEGFKAWLSSLRTLVLATSLTVSAWASTVARAEDVLKIEASNSTEEKIALVTTETRKRLGDFIQANPSFEDPWFIKPCLEWVQLPKIDCNNDVNGILDLAELEKDAVQGRAKIAENEAKIAENEAKIAENEAKIALVSQSIGYLRESIKYQRWIVWLFQLFEKIENGIEPPANHNILWELLEGKNDEPPELLGFVRNLIWLYERRESIPSGSITVLAWFIDSYITLNKEKTSRYKESILHEFNGKTIPPDIQEYLLQLTEQDGKFSEIKRHISPAYGWKREGVTKYRDPRFASI